MLQPPIASPAQGMARAAHFPGIAPADDAQARVASARKGESAAFREAIETCLKKKYADFEGAATRSEYWWFALFVFAVGIVLSVVARPFAGLFCIATLLPHIAVGIRRLRPDRSGGTVAAGRLRAPGQLVDPPRC